MSNANPNFNPSQPLDVQGGIPETSAGTDTTLTTQPETQTELIEKLLAPLAEVAATLSQIWAENRRTLVALGFVLALLPLLTLVVSLLAVFHTIPFLSSLFRLVGVGYALWFISRYFFEETKRQKLIEVWQRLLAAAKSR